VFSVFSVVRSFAVLLVAGLASAEPAPLSARAQAEDFDAMARAIERDYAYLGPPGAWKRAREAWRPKAVAAASRPAFVAALEGALSELRDDHVGLSGEGVATARRVPAETDLWASWQGTAALITAVRTSSVADVAGLHPGQRVVSIQGVAVERVVREKLGNARSDPAARDWALRHVIAGPRNGAYFIGVREGPADAPRQLEVGSVTEANGNAAPLLARKVGEDRDIGYLRLRDNLGDEGLVAHFDAALLQLKDTRALLLDLRNTPSGGSDAVVRALLGRFVEAEAPWQVRVGRGKARTTDTVAPRGPFTYRAPLVVLVDRWTAAEGEALAAGLHAAAKATLLGTGMAGLRGVRREVSLPNSGITVAFPAERTLHVNGKPRESLRPDIEVDLAKPSGGPGDPILYQGLKLLEARPRK